MEAPAHIAEVEIHPAAQMFPEMPHKELSELFESVKANGVRQPLYFYGGKLLDGRNRARVAVMLGKPISSLPSVNLPLEIDPYQFAYNANCERYTYSAQEKADIWLRIAEESGVWADLKAAAHAASEESKRRKKPVASKRQQEQETDDEGHVAHASPAPVVVSEIAAKAARVSARTMRRAIQKRQGGKPKKAKASQPTAGMRLLLKSMTKLAAFLVQRLPSDEIERLWVLLGKALRHEAAA